MSTLLIGMTCEIFETNNVGKKIQAKKHGRPFGNNAFAELLLQKHPIIYRRVAERNARKNRDFIFSKLIVLERDHGSLSKKQYEISEKIRCFKQEYGYVHHTHKKQLESVESEISINTQKMRKLKRFLKKVNLKETQQQELAKSAS